MKQGTMIKFLRYTFITRSLNAEKNDAPVIGMGSLEPVEHNRQRGSERETGGNDTAHAYNVLVINRVLAVVLIGSLFAIIVYPLVAPGIEVPKIVEHAFSATLGYFGSALVTYFERSRSRRE